MNQRFFCKLTLNVKLSNVTYSSVINTYEDIITSIKEVANEVLSYLLNARRSEEVYYGKEEGIKKAGRKAKN